MNWKLVKTEQEYKKALRRAMEIFHAEPDTPEDEELGVLLLLLLLLIKDYEDRHIKMPEVDVLALIREKMDEKGLKNKDLEAVIGSKGHVSSVLSGKRALTLKMAQRLKDFFQLPAEVFLKAP